ncbi:MAG: GntR family transcriptional regulator, partial [Pseudomonadales bacterium]
SENSQLRLSERIHQWLLERIIYGDMKPGDAVAEKTIAQTLGVSRTPVHDALRDLIKDGFLHQERNKRPVVTAFTAEDVFDIFEIRILLEGEAAFKAAARMDRLTLKQLRERANVLSADTAAPDWLESWAQYDDDFHREIAKASGSKRLLQDIVRHRLSHRALNVHASGPETFSDSLNEHDVILSALEQRDSDMAKAAMRAHIRESQALFVNQFSKGY